MFVRMFKSPFSHRRHYADAAHQQEGGSASPLSKEKLRPIIVAGPDPVKDGVVRWRCVDLKRVIKERFGVDLGEISVGRLLKELGFSYVSARPQHPEQSPQVIEDFKKNSQRQWRKR